MNRKPQFLYTALMLLAAFFTLFVMCSRVWLQTDLTALLPSEQQPDVLWQKAEVANQAQLNGQVVLLAGSQNSAQAFQTATEIAALWQKSGVFASVDSRIEPDLAQVARDVAQLDLAVLPEAQRDLLVYNPERYFQERAEAAVNPFAVPSPLPLDQDWLGFGRFVTTQAQAGSRLQWNMDNGMLFTEDKAGITWVWLRARLKDSAIAGDKAGLLLLMEESRALAQREHVQILAAGGALFAAQAKATAQYESRLMSAAGILLTFSLLLWVFLSARVFALLLPLAAGLLLGLAVSLAVFGQLHILTLVIGTSLVGMLVDFPLHWLTPAVFPSRRFQTASWQAEAAMRDVVPTFLVSLLITVLGYALLWFTPLPVLRQTAVFSGVALLGAFGATVWWLPSVFRHYQPRRVPFATSLERIYPLLKKAQKRARRRGWQALLLVLMVAGVWKSDWHDDIRQWIAMPPEMLQQAQQIGQLSGQDLSGQYVLLEGRSEDELLQRNAQLHQALQPLLAKQQLGGVQSLDQWAASTHAQKAVQARLLELAQLPKAYAPLRELGVPKKIIQTALQSAAQRPVLSLEETLQTPLAEAWQALYLGEVAAGRYASVVRLHDVKNAAAVQAVVHTIEGAQWADQRAHLNDLFHHTRNQAAWLKLVSYALAFVLLWKVFGARRGGLILAVPLGAAIGTVALLGWLSVPVSLFAMFGLLLVSAIGVDYAVYAYAAHETAPARLGGMLLAALSTGISFGLLSFSSTPAVASFGITVALGVVLNVWLASALIRDHV